MTSPLQVWYRLGATISVPVCDLVMILDLVGVLSGKVKTELIGTMFKYCWFCLIWPEGVSTR